MRTRALASSEIARGRKLFAVFYVLNTVSFQLLSGNIITLYALRLGAGTFLIGTLSAFTSFAPVLVLVGRPIAMRMKATTLMGAFWVARYFLMVPILLAAPFARTGFIPLALALLTISVLGFNVARGVAITTFNPILGALAEGPDRGSFIAYIQLIINATSLAAGVAMALLLGEAAPLGMYTAFLAVGILTGLAASWLVFRLPEPRGFRAQASRGLMATVRRSLASASFVRYAVSVAVVSFAAAMAGPFLIVYVKQVYGASDSQAVFFTVIGLAGALVMALASGLTIDRLGGKPLYYFFAAATAISLVPVIASPPLSAPVTVWLFAGGIFFLFTLGTAGTANAAQTYLFSITPSREDLNAGIIYQLVSGLAGAAGALSGGAFLEWLAGATRWEPVNVFRLSFAAVTLLNGLALWLVSRLSSVGAYSIRESLAIIFSPRDMRALSLLQRLNRSRSVSEEQSGIDALAQSQSELSTDQLLAKLTSPRFAIRSAALEALRSAPPDERVDKALIAEVRNRPFTTAHIAAEILGEKRVQGAVKILRQGLRSEDYYLCAKCMVSLALLGDLASIPTIASIVERTENPGLIIHGARALETTRHTPSLGLLLAKARKCAGSYLLDELILSMAGVMGIEQWFYPIFNAFINSPEEATGLLRDFIGEKAQESGKDVSPVSELAGSIAGKHLTFVARARDILVRVAPHSVVSSELCGSLDDPDLARVPRFRLFVTCAVLWLFLRGPEE